jgi:2-amino-4-hydroxy-6-hydroxymethyldihydropteridine diphosphokinase
MIAVAMTTREADCDQASAKQVEARRATVYLALGTNLADREANLREAIRRIAALGLAVTRRSSIYETEPVGFGDQDWFLNQVIEAEMSRELIFDLNEKDAPPHKRDDDVWVELGLTEQLVRLLAALLGIESEMGRRRVIVNGPRLIDIDILLCDGISGVFGNASLPQLILPHPRMHLRRFVLAPLCEIAPAVIHPAMQRSVCELLAALNDPAIVRVYQNLD